jgi:hypothetical protein
VTDEQKDHEIDASKSPSAKRAVRGSPRFWAVLFIGPGVVALACIPTALLFEHFRWWESPVHGTSFGASIVCAVSAFMYLLIVRRQADRPVTLGVPTRGLAYAAIGLAGGFLMAIAATILLIALSRE